MNLKKIVAIGFLGCFLIGSVSAQDKIDVLYKQVDGKDLHLDIYYPTGKQDSKLPVVVYTHGGGWAAGSKEGAKTGPKGDLIKKLVEQGFCVVSVQYRLTKQGSNITIKDCIVDSKDAIRYLAKNSKSLNIDPMRIFLFGDSAGGQIAQILLLTSPKSFPGDEALADARYKVVAGVSWYGPCDFEKTDLFNYDDSEDFKDRFEWRIMGASSPDEKTARYREVSPINYLTKNSPPLLMIQGNKDTTIPVKHAYYMQEKAKKLKAPVEIMIINNAGHNWRKVDADVDPSIPVIIDRSAQFFVDHL